MDTFRYIVTSLLVTLVPAFLLYGLLLHSGLPLWPKLGISAAQYLLWSAVVAVAFLLAIWREATTREPIRLPADPGRGRGCVSGRICRGALADRAVSAWARAVGFAGNRSAALWAVARDGGPYAYTRHPRTSQILLAWAGWALLANYPAGYFTVLLSIPLLLVIAHLEEGELHRRFHREYEIYARRVARFWPDPRAASHQVEA